MQTKLSSAEGGLRRLARSLSRARAREAAVNCDRADEANMFEIGERGRETGTREPAHEVAGTHDRRELYPGSHNRFLMTLGE